MARKERNILKEDKGHHFLIIGVSGSLAQGLARLILKTFPRTHITGVDSRDPPDNLISDRIHFNKIRYNRSNFEKLFRNHKFDYVFHLGRLSHAIPKANILERADVNVVGTQRILELALKHGIKKTVILSTFHVYGAFPDNPLYIPEDSPLRASFRYHELHDVVEMDQSSVAFMWRNRDKMDTIIFRPCNIVGEKINNAISLFLKTPLGPKPIDFRPMFQFIHKSDMIRILLRSIDHLPSGVYNVAPNDTISLNRAKRLLGELSIPAPISLLAPIAKVIGIPWHVPQYLFDYLKYSCVIDNKEIKRYLGEDICHYSSESAILEMSKSEPGL